MSDKKNYENYDDLDQENLDKSYNSKAIKEQETLDFYNDDMSKKAVNALFKDYSVKNQTTDSIVKNPSESKSEKKTFGYDGGEKQNTVRKPKMAPIQSEPEEEPETSDKVNKDYSYQSLDYENISNASYKGYKYSAGKKDYDFRNTSFSQEKLKEEQEARDEVKRNKEILRKLQSQETNAKELLEVGLYKTVEEHEREHQKVKPKLSAKEQRRRQTMIFRICTTVFIIFLLVCIIGLLISRKNLKEQVAEQALLEEKYTQQSLELNALKDEISILNDALSKIDVKESEPTTTPTENTDKTATTNETYTVKAGDSLSGISKSVYGDSSKFQIIYDANNLTSSNLYVGQELIIPAQ